MSNLLKPEQTHCPSCGVPNTIEIEERLWDLYTRIRDGRSTYEPLVFTSDWIQENVQDEDDYEAIQLAMGRDMYDRGLCPVCGRPDLRGVKPEDIMDENEAREMSEMWAEQAAERRMGA
jgi:hypothetical protein